MSVHATRAARRAAVHETHIARAAAAARARHQPRGLGGAGAPGAPAHDRAERAPGAAAVHAADPGAQHLPDGRAGRGAAAALPSRRRASAAPLHAVHAEPPESHPVAGLQEEPLVRNLLWWDLGRLAEPDHGDPVDGLAVRDDAPHADSGLDREAGRPATHHHAVGEKHAGAETLAADRHRACGAAAGGHARAAAAALLRLLHTTEAGADAAQLSPSAQAFIAGLYASSRADGRHAHRPHH